MDIRTACAKKIVICSIINRLKGKYKKRVCQQRAEEIFFWCYSFIWRTQCNWVFLVETNRNLIFAFPQLHSVSVEKKNLRFSIIETVYWNNRVLMSPIEKTIDCWQIILPHLVRERETFAHILEDRKLPVDLFHMFVSKQIFLFFLEC